MRWKAKGVYFRLRVLEGEQKAVANFDGQQVINLGSNNYLGLTTHKALRRAAIEAIRRYGAGAGAVRTIAGTMRPHTELEEQIASFQGLGGLRRVQIRFLPRMPARWRAILGKDDLILSDSFNHASIIDGCRLSRAAIRVFKHRDMEDCERLCRETTDWPGHKLLISDGVFSMDGDIAPLPELCELAEKYNCIMMVDDAHASGVLGRGGRGTVDHLGCQGRVDIQVGTLSKAVGAMGGYVCGSRVLIDFLHHRARPFLFSTGLPPSVTASCQAAFTLLDSPEGERLIKKLWANTQFFQKRLRRLRFLHGRQPNPHHADPGWRGRQSVRVFKAALRGWRFRTGSGLSDGSGGQITLASDGHSYPHASRPRACLRHHGRGWTAPGNRFVIPRRAARGGRSENKPTRGPCPHGQRCAFLPLCAPCKHSPPPIRGTGATVLRGAPERRGFQQ